MWLKIAKEFNERANFPNCLGAVDGKYIRIIKPERSGSLYMNYKHYFSIGLLAIADANYKFIYVDVGSYGKDSDSTIFKNSALWENLKKNNLNIPASTTVPGTGLIFHYHTRLLVTKHLNWTSTYFDPTQVFICLFEKKYLTIVYHAQDDT